MSNESRDPLKKQIREAADHIDVDTAIGLQVNDPLLGLLQYEIATGSKPEEALTSVVESVASASEAFLGILDYPPKAVGGADMARRIKEQGIPEHVAAAAFDHLIKSGQIDEINGWYFRVPQ